MDEEERAVLYRQQVLARVRNRKAMDRLLKGDPVARKALEANWKPLEPGQEVPLIWERV